MKLRRDGPLGPDEFKGATNESKRKHGLAKLELTAHSAGKNSTFGRTKPIYYLSQEHDPADVLEKWVAVNEPILQGRGLTTESVTRALSKSDFKKAWKAICEQKSFEVLDEPDYSDRGGGQSEDRACPYCGKSIKRLPTHIPSCPEK
jgi:hypothetical protein